MKNPDERHRNLAQSGASNGQSSSFRARNPSENGKRKPCEGAVSEIGTMQKAADTGRTDTEKPTSYSQPKRLRRRRRGKMRGTADVVSQTALAPADAPAQRTTVEGKTVEGKPSGKISNRRRRARKKKQTRIESVVAGSCEVKQIVQANCSHNSSHSAAIVSKRGPISPARHTRCDAREAPLYAALDLGTNNCRLLIATPTRPGLFRVVDAFSRIVRLGEGLSATGRLSENAMQRAVEALKICSEKLASKKIRRARLIATEACRSAENGEEFLKRVRDETALQLEIVDRQTEARLAVSGCGTLITRETDAVVLFDIGGGSSEIALIDVSERRSPRLAEHIRAWTSLPVGVVTLAERFGGRNVTPESYDHMVRHVTELLSTFAQRHCLGHLTAGSRFHLLGTSGTVTTLAGIHLGLERYDRRRVDGMWMGAEEVTQMTNQLLSWDFEARVANPCIGADRADLVLAGCAILDAIRIVWPSEKLLIADRGLREGILTELMSRDGAWRQNRSSNVHNSVRNRH